MLLILLRVYLVWPVLPLELLSLIELNDDRALLPLVLVIQELLLSPPKVTLHPLMICVSSLSPSLIIILLLHPCKTRLRKYVLTELTAPEFESMKESFR